MVNGDFQGPAIRYYWNGSRTEGNIVNGIFQGPVIRYYVNGPRACLCSCAWVGPAPLHGTMPEGLHAQ